MSQRENSEEIEAPVFVRIGRSGRLIKIGTFSEPAGLPELFRNLANWLEMFQGDGVTTSPLFEVSRE